MPEALHGTCLCKSVAVSVRPKTEEMSVCHCEMCRRWSSGPFMVVSCGSDVEIKGKNVKTFRSSDWAERVFCGDCGTVIAWRLADDGGENHVNAQLFEETNNYPIHLQVFIDEKPDNYSFANQTKTMTSSEIFAMFSSPEGS